MPPFIHLLLVLAGLIILNELFRASKWFSLAFFIGLTLVMTAFVWPKTAGPGTSVSTWFHWAKIYSVIIACIGFTFMRFTPLGEKSYAKAFPAAILALNILEAVIRDFELGITAGGIWHILNGVAGILSIITISGWTGIFAEKKGKRDLIWPDMTTAWIIAYDIWNLTYIYFCVPEHATYGISVLLACTIPALFIKKGTWIQARAYTLGVWMMYIFTFNAYIDIPGNTIMLPEAVGLKMAFALVSIAANGALAFHFFYKIKKKNSYSIGCEVYV